MLDEIVSTNDLVVRSELSGALESFIKTSCNKSVVKETMKLISRTEADIEAVRVLAEHLNDAKKIMKALDAIYKTWSSDEDDKIADMEKLRIFLNNDRVEEKLFDADNNFKNPSGVAGKGLLNFLSIQAVKINPKYANYNWVIPKIKGEEDMTDVEKILYAADNCSPAVLKAIMGKTPLRAVKRAFSKANPHQTTQMLSVANRHQQP